MARTPVTPAAASALTAELSQAAKKTDALRRTALAIAAELSQASFVGTTRPRRPPRQDVRRGAAELDVMYQAGEWEGVRPLHLVLLHERLHEEVYGAPEALTAKERSTATALASRLLRVEFAGDVAAMLGYLRFAWKRERAAERRRREAGGNGRRLSWRFVFAAKFILSDYRVELARDGKRVR